MGKNTIGASILALRTALVMTQQGLAVRVGTSPMMISHWECGRRSPSLANAIKLATALKVTLDRLVFGGRTNG